MIRSVVTWHISAARLPKRNALYVISDHKRTGVARYFPKLKVWRYPNHRMTRVTPILWAPLPVPQIVKE